MSAVNFTCLGCGRITPDDDGGCLACDLCAGCTPAAGNCFDCRDMRAELSAELWASETRR